MKKGIQMKGWLYILLIILLICLVGVCNCGGGGGSPSSAVKSFYTAMNAGDFDKAEECLLPGQSVRGLDLCEFMGKIEKVKILDEEVGEMFGTKVATVVVNVTLTPAGKSHWLASLQEGTQTFLLEKHKTGWKIATWY
jgi:hypothetical protein